MVCSMGKTDENPGIGCEIYNRWYFSSIIIFRGSKYVISDSFGEPRHQRFTRCIKPTNLL